MPTDSSAATPAPKLIKARVLATGVFGNVDTVVKLPPDALAHGVAAGQLDPHPDAVAYAESMSGEVIDGIEGLIVTPSAGSIEEQPIEPFKAIDAAPENKVKRTYTRKAK